MIQDVNIASISYWQWWVLTCVHIHQLSESQFPSDELLQYGQNGNITYRINDKKLVPSFPDVSPVCRLAMGGHPYLALSVPPSVLCEPTLTVSFHQYGKQRGKVKNIYGLPSLDVDNRFKCTPSRIHRNSLQQSSR